MNQKLRPTELFEKMGTIGTILTGFSIIGIAFLELLSKSDSN